MTKVETKENAFCGERVLCEHHKAFLFGGCGVILIEGYLSVWGIHGREGSQECQYGRRE